MFLNTKLFQRITICNILMLSTLAVGISHDKFDEEWKQFKKNFAKQFKSATEEEHRLNIFVENLKQIKKHNEKYQKGEVTYKKGINEFTDMSYEEFASRMLRANINDEIDTTHAVPYEQIRGKLSMNKQANSFDWRERNAVSPVKSQGRDCGSCWAFATIAGIESHTYIQYGNMVTLSEQQLVDCDQTNNGCQGGNIFPALEYVILNGGVNSDQLYPYEERENVCRYNPYNVAAQVTGFVRLPIGDENELKDAVNYVGPVITGIFGSDDLKQHTEGIYVDNRCGNTTVNHAVLIVGYGSENGHDYWIFKNSWGNSWAEEGYGKIARNKNNMCGIALMSVFPIL